jgi:rod shape determining protein RodA
VVRSIYWPLVLIPLALTFIGVAFIYSATAINPEVSYATRQLMWLALGMTLMAIAFMGGYKIFIDTAYIFYILSLILLLAVWTVGVEKSGAQRWLELGIFQLQPSEVCKIATILALAKFLGSHKAKHSQFIAVAVAFGIVILPLVLILMQPDLGTALIFVPVLFCILFVWGCQLRYLLVPFFLVILSTPLIWNFILRDYQKRRLLVFINPNIDPLGSGYTAIQSKIAVGSGQLFGKGWLEGTQNQLKFLPEHHTDFIFSVIGEEWGFIGALVIVGLFMVFLWKAIDMMHVTTDVSAKLLTCGIVSIFFFHVVVNIGMTVGLMPITGLPLPFLSYGGSSLLTSFFCVGLLLSVYKERSIFS